MENKDNKQLQNIQKRISVFNNFLKQQTIQGKTYKQEIQTFSEQLPAILDDFQQYYIFYNKNPEYSEYQQMFENIKGNLNKISSQLFTIENEIETSNQNINNFMKEINTIIHQERVMNNRLKRRHGIIYDTHNSSEQIIDDYNLLYDRYYLRNWGIFVGILIAIYACSIFSSNIGESVKNIKPYYDAKIKPTFVKSS